MSSTQGDQNSIVVYLPSLGGASSGVAQGMGRVMGRGECLVYSCACDRVVVASLVDFLSIQRQLRLKTSAEHESVARF